MKDAIARLLASVTLVLLLGGCASKNVRVNCEAHLQPINPPVASGSRQTSGRESATAALSISREKP